jgi:ComF family protein
MDGVCAPCWSGMTPWIGPACVGCGLPLASPAAGDIGEPRCSACRKEQPHFDLARSCGIYTGALRAAVLELKFQRRERLARKLGGMLAAAWLREPALQELVAPILIPVPLHKSREKGRGFNQSLLLAQNLQKSLRDLTGCVPDLNAALLVRTRPTLPQAGLSVSARRENVRGVFALSRQASARNREFVLIDDVMTTGATLSACAAALKKQGAAKVLALTVARATPEFTDLLPSGVGHAVDASGNAWP